MWPTTECSFGRNHKKHPVLVDKFQLASSKEKQLRALQDAKATIATNTGKNMDDKQILKKVANIKAQVKKKTDANETANRTINLCSWEKDLFDVLRGEENPTIKKMASAISAGVCSSSCAKNDMLSHASADARFGIRIFFSEVL